MLEAHVSLMVLYFYASKIIIESMQKVTEFWKSLNFLDVLIPRFMFFRTTLFLLFFQIYRKSSEVSFIIGNKEKYCLFMKLSGRAFLNNVSECYVIKI
jgi:hypothetical protein